MDGRLAAQSALYRSRAIGDELKNLLANYFFQCSTKALDQTLGLGTQRFHLSVHGTNTDLDTDLLDYDRQMELSGGLDAANREREVEFSPEVCAQVIKALWTSELVEAICADLATPGRDRKQLVDLLASMPIQSARDGLGRLLQKEWRKGPAVFAGVVAEKDDDSSDHEGYESLMTIGESQPAITASWRDPGQLLLLKSIPQMERPRGEDAEDAEMTRGTLSGKSDRRERERERKYVWFETNLQLVRQLNQRFGAGAARRTMSIPGKEIPFTDIVGEEKRTTESKKRDADVTADVAGLPSQTGTFPFALHEGAKVVAEYHVTWPDDLANDDVSGIVGPLTIHYACMREKGSPDKVRRHYETTLKARSRTINGYWLESVSRDDTTGKSRSIDVLLPASVPASYGRSKDEAVALTVEVLYVEIPAVTR